MIAITTHCLEPIPIISAKAGLKAIRRLPTGLDNNNDQRYEREACGLLA